LEKAVVSRAELVSASEQEIEIRAATVQAVEQIRKELKKEYQIDIMSLQLGPLFFLFFLLLLF
jgi:hypothetical protein